MRQQQLCIPVPARNNCQAIGNEEQQQNGVVHSLRIVAEPVIVDLRQRPDANISLDDQVRYELLDAQIKAQQQDDVVMALEEIDDAVLKQCDWTDFGGCCCGGIGGVVMVLRDVLGFTMDWGTGRQTIEERSHKRKIETRVTNAPSLCCCVFFPFFSHGVGGGKKSRPKANKAGAE